MKSGRTPNPRLLATNGPLEGRTFPLDSDHFRIGRHTDNDLVLARVEVSRRHCELRRQPDGTFRVVDLDSRHGVFVNARPVRERELSHSDMLTIGTTVLLYLIDDTASWQEPEEPGTASSFVAGNTVAQKPTEILYLDSQRLQEVLPAHERIAHDLHVLLRASTSLLGPLDSTAIADRLLDALFSAIPAERCALLLREPGSDEWHPLASRQRSTDTAASVRPDRQILAAVLEERAGLLMARDGGAAESDETDETAGAAPARDRRRAPAATLAAPLLDRDESILGAVYAESGPATGFEERHLELVGALAGITSLALSNALRLEQLERENRRLQAHQLQHDIVGESPPVDKLLDQVGRVARAETTVLLRGESGTGKELTAQAIHRSGPRASGPFVAINCATLSETLIESELFGHEKGAFTGALARTTGKLEAADGGTLFLDEVAEIPVGLQAKLLRVLQERQFERVGGTRPIRVDVRVIAATNRDLEAAIRDGLFREDLYYRLKVITLETPPLRERGGDVALLARHFLTLHGRQLGRRGAALTPAALRALASYPWPGNVRELSNVIERALVLGGGETIHLEDLPPELTEGAGPDVPSSFQAALGDYKRKLVKKAFQEAGGDYGAAAALLGIHVNSLHRMIRRLGLKSQLSP